MRIGRTGHSSMRALTCRFLSPSLSLLVIYTAPSSQLPTLIQAAHSAVPFLDVRRRHAKLLPSWLHGPLPLHPPLLRCHRAAPDYRRQCRLGSQHHRLQRVRRAELLIHLSRWLLLDCAGASVAVRSSTSRTPARCPPGLSILFRGLLRGVSLAGPIADKGNGR